MSSGQADRIVAAARDLVGVRFRLQGRSRASGVDCVGPRGYGLRSGDEALARAWLTQAGLVAVERPKAGDLALVRPGPLQLHLMILVPGGHVHAHAGLGRVVETPGPSPWPVIGHWRTIEEETWRL